MALCGGVSKTSGSGSACRPGLLTLVACSHPRQSASYSHRFRVGPLPIRYAGSGCMRTHHRAFFYRSASQSRCRIPALSSPSSRCARPSATATPWPCPPSTRGARGGRTATSTAAAWSDLGPATRRRGFAAWTSPPAQSSHSTVGHTPHPSLPSSLPRPPLTLTLSLASPFRCSRPDPPDRFFPSSAVPV